MARDFSIGKLININIQSAGHIHDFHVEHHFYGRRPIYNQARYQDMENCHDSLGFVNVLKFTKNIGRKCVENSYALAYGVFTWLKVAVNKSKPNEDIEKNQDAVMLQSLRNDIEELKEMVKELQKHKNPAASVPKLHVGLSLFPPPPPPPPPPPTPVQNVLPRPHVKRGATPIASVAPTKPTISLEDLLKVKLKKPSERKFQPKARKSVDNCASIQRVALRSSRTPIREAANLPEAELSKSPVSSLKRLLSNANDVNRPKRRRKQFLEIEDV